MGRHIRRPTGNTNYGTIENVVGDSDGLNTLGDNNMSSGKAFFSESGTILSFSAPFSMSASIPAGRDVIAVRCAHIQRNGGAFGIFNGWVSSFLRFSGNKASESEAFKKDAYSDSGRTVEGPPLYKPTTTGTPGAWTEAEINTISMITGTKADFPEGKEWCWALESYIIVVYNDVPNVPSAPFPANAQTIATSSVDFSADANVPQVEQPIQVQFQVSQDSTFATGVSSFTGGLQSTPGAGAKSYFDSDTSKGTYTNLGPGTWYLRMRAVDAWGRYSAFSSTTTFTIAHAALPVPTLTIPASGATVISPYAIREGNIATTPPGERKVGLTWQFCQNSDFSSSPVVAWANVAGGRFDAGKVSYDPLPDGSTPAGLYGYKVSPDDPSQYLKQGIWYGRVRTSDRWGQVSGWSTPLSFTVTHPPVAQNIFPSGAKKFDQVTQVVSWTLGDPWSGDSQTAYRMVVRDLADNVLQDTGKVISTVPQAVMSTSGGAHLQEDLKLQVWLWDLDDVVSTVATDQFFTMSKAPVITITSPTPDGVDIVTGQPTITWSNVFARGDVTQKSYEIRFYDAGTGVIAHQTGKVTSTATSWSAPRSILRNLVDYQIALTVTDSDDLPATTYRNFTTNFVRPVAIEATVTVDPFMRDGYVTVDYPTAAPDPYFIEYRIYRRRLGDTEWVLAGTVGEITTLTFRDWLVGGHTDYQWGVVQAVDRFGSVVEGLLDESAPYYPVFTEEYWMIDPDDETNNVRVAKVVGDKYTDETERNSFTIVGRGIHRNYGTRTGKSGTLTITVRMSSVYTCTQQIAALRHLAAVADVIYMRDPYGNVTPIDVGDPDVDRMAGVTEEFADVSLPYQEVPDMRGVFS